jgi:hypothetical protein
MFRLSLYPIAESYTLVIAAAVVLVLLLLSVRVGKDRLTLKQRLGLAALRLVVIAAADAHLYGNEEAGGHARCDGR